MLSELFKSFVDRRPTGNLTDIHPVKQFRSILEHERVRSIRSGQVLSLVVFDAGKPHAKTGENKNGLLVQALAGRIRSTDEIGWLDKQHIGAILPYTSAEGAWKLASDVCRSMACEVSPPDCAVYTFPSNWFSDNDGQSIPNDSQEAFSEKRTVSQSVSASVKNADRIENAGFTVQSSALDKRAQNHISSKDGPPSIFHSPLPAWKRAMDITGAALGLFVLSPIMILVIVVIKTISPGPVFFKHPRVGYMGKIFTMWKFRTMKAGADTTVHQQYLSELINGAAHNDKNSARPMTKLDKDPQISPFGKILRQTYLDELPQLINVLRGEMTLVGPRPPIPYEVKEYLCWHKGRIDVVPGMTGLWQVSGKNRLTFNEMVRLDIRYWREKSFWLDLKILLRTPVVILSQIKDSLCDRKL